MSAAQRRVLLSLASTLAVAGVGLFIAAIWVDGELSKRLAATGSVLVICGAILGGIGVAQ